MESELNEKQSILEANINRIIENFKTKERLEIVGGKDMIFSEKDLKKITKICSQENKYNLLFKDMLNGKPYTEENARSFIKYAKDGWENQTHYIFFIRKHDGEIIGCIEIKGSSGEIGYWADDDYSGFMTNTVKEISLLAKESGFKKLFAWVREYNIKSIGVLERAGYKKVFEEDKEKKGLMFNYQKDLI